MFKLTFFLAVAFMLFGCQTQQYAIVKADGARIENEALMRGPIPDSASEQSVRAVQQERISQMSLPFDNPVELLYSTFPPYPKSLRQLGVEGVVEISIVVGKSGRVERATIVTAPHPELAELSLAAVRKWRFKPLTKAGKPVEAQFVQQFPFRLID